MRDHSVTTLGRSSHAIRKGKWKYIHYYDGSEELYDLRADPHEWRNLAGAGKHAAELDALPSPSPRLGIAAEPAMGICLFPAKMGHRLGISE